ncbi:AsmA-like C-terminal region-containing protein [Haloferula sargassicola]|uniref:AsmA-like C-terminal region-containing protein n=1 Tax=Haloferula sargassicola TaxID=490096 RepID=UPI0033653179
MRHIRIIHRLRTFGAIVGFLALAGLVGLIGWANETGLPDTWRQGIADALASQGIQAELASLRFIPFRGFEAGEVVIYSDASHQRVVGRLERLLFDLDRSRLTHGDFQIERLNLSGARFSLAADPLDPDSERLDVTDLSGRVEFSGPHSISISRASGMIHGVRLDANCRLDLFRSPGMTTPEEEDLARQERRKILLGVIHTLEAFDFDPSNPPRIRLEVRGDLEDPASLRASLNLRASQLQARDLLLREVDLRGELRGPALVLHQGSIVAGNGDLTGDAEYDLLDQSGRFNLRSTLDIPALVRQLRLPLPEALPSFSEPPVIEAKGDFRRRDGKWDYSVIGHATFFDPDFEGIRVDELSSSFAWNGTDLLLEDLHVLEGEGELTGRIYVQPDLIRYAATSTLPLGLWQRSISFEPLRTILNDFSGGPDLRQKVVFKGHAHPHQSHDWSFEGTAEAHGISFRGVPTREARVDLDLNGKRLDFNQGKVVFNYDDYPLKRRHGGPDTGSATVDQIRYDDVAKTVEIHGVRGDVWPAPVVRTFAPEVADHLEAYGFHGTPRLEADGVVGVLGEEAKTDLTVRFSTAGKLDYDFLDERLALDEPKGLVRVLPDKVLIEDLSFGALGGRARASLSSRAGPPETLSGAIDWTELDLEEIGKAYHFKNEFPGVITGRADFTLKGGEVAGLDGGGHVALEQAQLFDVPILGPLSPVIAAVLGNRKAGFQEAKSAFFSFDIQDGVLRSNDFLTTTRSLVFTGDGMADLNKLTLDMTVRMNARGLFGMITLPLKPFYGLFQFRGTGPFDDPKWDNVMFTSPPDEQNEKLLTPPRARPVDQPSAVPPRAKLPTHRRR